MTWRARSRNAFGDAVQRRGWAGSLRRSGITMENDPALRNDCPAHPRSHAAAIRARLRPLADPRIAEASQLVLQDGARRTMGTATASSASACRRCARSPASFAPRPSRPRSRFCARRCTRSGWSRCSCSSTAMRAAPRASGSASTSSICKHVPKHVNNWDLVDSSAHYIVGAHLDGRDRSVLVRARALAAPVVRAALRSSPRSGSSSAVRSTTRSRIAEILLDDEQDLIHKAAGWMLREVGNRDRAAAERFLQRHCRRMPRTMLRYAIEKFPERTRRAYLAGTPRSTRSCRRVAGTDLFSARRRWSSSALSAQKIDLYPLR